MHACAAQRDRLAVALPAIPSFPDARSGLSCCAALFASGPALSGRRMNLPSRSTVSIRRPGSSSASATGSSMKSVLPKRTEIIVRPGSTVRSPRTMVSTSGNSGILDCGWKIYGKGQTGRSDNAGHTQDFLVLFVAYRRNDQPNVLQEFHLTQHGLPRSSASVTCLGKRSSARKSATRFFPSGSCGSG